MAKPIYGGNQQQGMWDRYSATNSTAAPQYNSFNTMPTTAMPTTVMPQYPSTAPMMQQTQYSIPQTQSHYTAPMTPQTQYSIPTQNSMAPHSMQTIPESFQTQYNLPQTSSFAGRMPSQQTFPQQQLPTQQTFPQQQLPTQQTFPQQQLPTQQSFPQQQMQPRTPSWTAVSPAYHGSQEIGQNVDMYQLQSTATPTAPPGTQLIQPPEMGPPVGVQYGYNDKPVTTPQFQQSNYNTSTPQTYQYQQTPSSLGQGYEQLPQTQQVANGNQSQGALVRPPAAGAVPPTPPPGGPVTRDIHMKEPQPKKCGCC